VGDIGLPEQSGEKACALEDYGNARAYLTEALPTAYEMHTLAMLSKVLVSLALLFAKCGRRDRAAALLALTSQHSTSELDVKNRAHGYSPT
jgi:hypothetical protein